ncbi:MAG: hypothetical protein ACLFR1_01860 [Spirochaetia bacterium]
MKKIITILLILFVIISFPYAQETEESAAEQPDQEGIDVEPDEPGIVLPPMFLEIEDVTVENIEAVLPEDAEVLATDIAVPLPQEGQLAINDEAFDLPESEIQGTRVSEGETASFFSEGMIGVGSMNTITGSISLYKLGEDPRFRLLFGHTGLDGYAFRPQGSGFFSREEVLQGEGSMNTDVLALEGSASYTEKEEGTQQLTSWDSATYRFIQAGADISYNITESITASAGLDLDTVSQVLSGGAPETRGELVLFPEAAIGYNAHNWSVGIRGDYRYAFLSGVSGYQNQGLQGAIYLTGLLPFGLQIDSDVGVFWSPDLAFLYPFSVSVSGTAWNSFSYEVYGGFSVSPSSYSAFWQENPFVYTGTILGYDRYWEAAGQFSWNIISTLFWDTGLIFRRYDTEYYRIGSVCSETGMYPVSYGRRNSLSSQLGISWSWSTMLTLDFGWDWNILDRIPNEDAHNLSFSADYTFPDGTLGGTLVFSYQMSDTVTLPFIDLSGYFRMSEGVQLVLEGWDLLAPVLENGRPNWGPFIAPGFRVVFKAQISI